MKEILKLYKKGFAVAFANRMAYRGDFLISLIIMLVSELLAPVVTFLIYRNGASYPGWRLEEVMLIQGVFMLSRGIGFVMFFGMVGNTLSLVRQGEFDVMLIKPRSVLVMSMVNSVDIQEIGRVLTGALVCGLALTKLGMPSLSEWLWFSLLLMASLVVMFAFAVVMASTVIKWVGNGRVFEIFNAVVTFGMYPKTIFSQGFSNLITYVVPIMMIGFLPASALLGRNIPYMFVGIVASFGFLGAAMMIWRGMISYYTSAGG